MNIATLVAPVNPIQQMWGGQVSGGFLWIPAELIRRQADLRLSDGEMVVLLNLLSHWWKRGDLPFPRTSTLATRMGVHPRTVLRHLAGLEEKGLVRRVGRRSEERNERAAARYDMSGLIEKMKQVGAIEPFAKIRRSNTAEATQGLPVEDIPLS